METIKINGSTYNKVYTENNNCAGCSFEDYSVCPHEASNCVMDKCIYVKHTYSIKPFITGMLFMIIFGFIDNLFLILGMDISKPIVNMFSDPKLSAMIGNTISDAIGAVVAAGVVYIYVKITKVEIKEHLLSTVIGVTIGCLIPIGFYLLNN